jgi:thiol-disulfide isomerase/thioredoxin
MNIKQTVVGVALMAMMAGSTLALRDDKAPTPPAAPAAPTTPVQTKDPAPEAKPAELNVGDKAPALQVASFIKGAPITSYEPGMVYVVEFWATWCGPCIRMFPHLSELQQQYEGKVRIVGVNIWERPYDDKTLGKVTTFVEKQGDKMAYTVAFDGPDKKTDAAFMQATGQNSIPAAFIVDQNGVVAWMGHPGGMDEPLAQIVGKQWDLKKAADESRAEREAAKAERAKSEARQKQLGPINKKINAAVAAKDWDAALGGLDEIKALAPDLAGRIEMSKFNMLLRQADRPDQAYALKDALMANPEIRSTPAALNQVAFTVLEGQGVSRRDYDFALAFAVTADEVAKGADWMIADTLARAHFAKGDKAKAVEVQTRAIELARAGKPVKPEAADMTELEGLLKKFKGEGEPAAQPAGQPGEKK